MNDHSTFTRSDLDAVLADVTVHALDPLVGTVHHADILLGGGLVVGVGPGLITAAGDDGAIVVRGTGTTVVPAVLDAGAVPAGVPRGTAAGTLAPGAPAHLAVLARTDAPDLAAAMHITLTAPQHLRAAFRDGVPVWWHGTPVDPRPAASVPELTGTAVDPSRNGVGVDTSGFLHQELTADGRYRIDGDRIDHAGHTMRKENR
ncbi:amidohydrolase [Qaidamihabitans albus]|uniref:amidohydrolase n=1 Tax=Qaidamihabitans albus TaxID=2795733 RepID=UPI0018F10E2B|nr:amidohydrolase [Qaidamihabitans albus]